MIGALRTGVLRTVLLFGLWLLLTDNTATPELIAGGVVAVVAAAAAGAASALAETHTRISAGMLRRLHRPFLALVTDTLRVTRGLAPVLLGREPARGRLRAVPYTALGENCEDRGRRVLSEWAASMGPNRYAIGVDCERGELLVHELVPADGPLDPLELG